MKNLFKTILLLAIVISAVFTNPVKTVETEFESDIKDVAELVHAKDKRADIPTLMESIGNFFKSKNIARNIYYNGSRNLDIYHKKNDKTKRTVVMFIYGGIWTFGEKTLYSTLGDFLYDNGYVAVIPNYAQFPFGLVDDMVYDIGCAIKWVYNNIHKYGGDNQRIILMGHSSGAHLIALTLIQSSLNYIGRLPNIYKAVLLNGPYDFDVFSDIAKQTGITPENSDLEKLAKFVLGSQNACPTDILKYFPDKSISYLGANKFNVIITGEDALVPESSAQGLLQQIRRTSDVPFSYYIMPQVGHSGLTEGLMRGDTGIQGFVLYVIAN
ncbi:alpha/beta-hydrolase [Anaeromyces robustus]|jgi:acetyl esterase/lipase|uniref:Alpha/beta-hydrolase n=1 Tax=Anaeromyces robustus TaxID=1754192 RepID=A0A1Y1WYQ9_9FUNG|nr:alpha/beta-hydrolase [Anaeromyces robustus]|eukprot:ORX78326.1 alpha/beta-hydrolase [Anaeromyces robustus]